MAEFLERSFSVEFVVAGSFRELWMKVRLNMIHDNGSVLPMYFEAYTGWSMENCIKTDSTFFFISVVLETRSGGLMHVFRAMEDISSCFMNSASYFMFIEISDLVFHILARF
jgi:hypothetical protein